MTEIIVPKNVEKMLNVHGAYISAICGERLVLVKTFNCKTLVVKHYRVLGTNWLSTGVFFGKDLIAIITENYKIYEFVNMFHYSEETTTKIEEDLAQYISDIRSLFIPYMSYPK